MLLDEARQDDVPPLLNLFEIIGLEQDSSALASAASRVPGIKSSSALSFSTCGDAGAP